MIDSFKLDRMMQALRLRPGWRSDALALAVISLTVLAVFAMVFRRGFDPIIDVGRDYYYATAVAHGATPYLDFRYNYPPVALYLLAAWTSVAGATLDSFAILGLATALSVAATLYFLGRELRGAAAGFVAAELFATLSAGGRTNVNYFYPYAHAATLGSLFLMLFLLSAVIAVRVRRPGSIACAFVFATLAAWSKLEFALAVAVAGVVITILGDAPRRILLLACTLAICSVVTVHLLFSGDAPPLSWFENVSPAWLMRGEGAVAFHRSAAGLNDIRGHFTDIALGLLLYATFHFLEWSTRERSTTVRIIVVVLALAAGVGVPVDLWLRPWLILLILEAIRRVAARRFDWVLCVIFVALACAIRIPLNIVPRGYGFTLLMPLYVCIGVLLFEEDSFGGWRGNSGRAVWLLILVGISIRALNEEHAHYATATHEVRTARGIYYDRNADRAVIVNRFVETVQKLPSGGMTVIPEGVMLNFLTGRPQPLYFYIFTAAEIGQPEIETRLLSDWARRAPSFIVEVPRSTAEYGGMRFGVEYGRRFASKVTAFDPIQTWRRPEFWLRLRQATR